MQMNQLCLQHVSLMFLPTYIPETNAIAPDFSSYREDTEGVYLVQPTCVSRLDE